MSKELFAACPQHHDCTMRCGFVPIDDGGYDMATDSKPLSQHLQSSAEAAFGEVYCVSVEHLPGALDIRRVT